MYVNVRLLNGFERLLTYKLPVELSHKKLLGTVIAVPLRKRREFAYVVEQFAYQPSVEFEIREAFAESYFPEDELFQRFISELSAFFFTTPFELYRRLKSFLDNTDEDDLLESVFEEKESDEVLSRTVILTAEQQEITTAVRASCDEGLYRPALLHGVTGSGKTEIYKQMIEHLLDRQKSIFFLVPEVSLARQFEKIFRKTFPNALIFGFYSGITKSHKQDLWRALLQKKPILVVGVHLPLLLPLSNLGGIIIDEEHETGFLEKKPPVLNSKQGALLRARLYRIPILLGSATPSVTTLYHAYEQKWPIYRLLKRFTGKFPRITHVLLTDQHKRKHFWFTEALITALKETIARGDQAIIYINRRGYSSFAQCIGCGHILMCPACAVSLTIHGGAQDQKLLCHYCDYIAGIPAACPQCKSTRGMKQKGVGTEKIIEMLATILPAARVGRADTDMSKKKKAWAETLEKFSNHELDILVGTQIITKGYHFPKVTLVGVIWADSSVHFPIYNSHEIALQQLLQVAGRAGRASDTSEVIIQSFEKHDIFTHLDESKYEEFYRSECEMRSFVGYPPFKKLIMLELRNRDEVELMRDANVLKCFLADRAIPEMVICGPSIPMIARIAHMHIRTIYIKAVTYKSIHALLQQVPKKLISSHYEISIE